MTVLKCEQKPGVVAHALIPLSTRLRQNCNFKARPEMKELTNTSALSTDPVARKHAGTDTANRQVALATLSLHADTQAPILQDHQACQCEEAQSNLIHINTATP